MTELVWILGFILLICFGFIVFRGAPYVPSHRNQLERAFRDIYPLTSHDTLVDLGSGDGIVLSVAATHGAQAIGYELNPLLVLVSRYRLRRYPRARIITKDFLLLNELPVETTVVYAFTTGHNIEEIGRKMEVWSQHKKLSFISYGFTLKGKTPVASVGAMYLYEFGTTKA